MTITAANILSQVEDRCSDTDINDVGSEIAFILNDLSNHFPFLQTSGTVAVTSQATALPAGFRSIKAIADSDGGKIDLVDLDVVLSGERLEGDAGTIERAAIWGSNLYVHPVPGSSATITLYYAEDHDVAQSAVTLSEWPDHFELAIVHGVVWQVYDQKGVMGEAPKAVAAKQAYDERIAALSKRYAERAGITG